MCAIKKEICNLEHKYNIVISVTNQAIMLRYFVVVLNALLELLINNYFRHSCMCATY